jgi:hypothetical protein
MLDQDAVTMRGVQTRKKWRASFLTVHRVGGLVAALPLLVLAMTGCIMAFETQIDAILHPSLFRVIPQGQALPLSAILPRVQRELGDSGTRPDCNRLRGADALLLLYGSRRRQIAAADFR